MRLAAALAALGLMLALPAAAQETAEAALTTYRLSGAASLRPSRIGDDGVHTYIQWDEDQPLPAVFAVNARGQEEIVDGYMRGDLFTIDRVHPRLVFRIDKEKAEARRQGPRKERP